MPGPPRAAARLTKTAAAPMGGSAATARDDSAAVGHGGHFSELAGVDGQGAAVMGGVFDHGPYDFATGLAAHDRAGREWARQILRAARAEKVDGVGERRGERLAGGGERGHGLQGSGVFGEIQVETLGPGCALDEPVESLGGVGDRLGDGHHAFHRTESGVGLIEDAGRALEEILAGEQLVGKVVRLQLWAHGRHYIIRRRKRE